MNSEKKSKGVDDVASAGGKAKEKNPGVGKKGKASTATGAHKGAKEEEKGGGGRGAG